MGLHRAERSIEIAAPPAACFDAIVDYESFPAWAEPAEAITVHSRYPDGLGKRVEVTVDLKVRHITYTLDYHYERPRRVWWEFVAGDLVSDIEGDYVFEPTPRGTRATYRLGIDLGLPVPGMIIRRLNEQSMRRSIEDLKAEVERRAAAA